MKILIFTLILLMTACGDSDQPVVAPVDNTDPVDQVDNNSGDDNQNIIPELPAPPQGAATDVIAYPLQNKYLNGLRDSVLASNILTLDKWEGLCISENETGKDYAFPMASVHLLEKVGFVSEDQDYADYIRNTWLYGIDLVNADVSDEDGSLISTGLTWLLDQSTEVNFDFLPDDSALYLFTKPMISAGHPYRSDGQTVGTLLYNIGDLQAMFNTDNSVTVHFYCLSF